MQFRRPSVEFVRFDSYVVAANDSSCLVDGRSGQNGSMGCSGDNDCPNDADLIDWSGMTCEGNA